jgi:hypothetical protein
MSKRKLPLRIPTAPPTKWHNDKSKYRRSVPYCNVCYENPCVCDDEIYEDKGGDEDNA